VAWLDYSRPLIGVALMLNGFSPTSGKAPEVAKARNFLIEHSMKAILVPDSTGQDSLLNGDVRYPTPKGGGLQLWRD